MILRFFAEPLSQLLHLVYGFVGDYGVSIVIFTILVKLVMIPLTVKQTKSMKNMQEIQPKIKELQKKYKHDKEKMNQKVMEVYKEHNVNPAGGCLPLLVQFPIIIGLFTVLREPSQYGFTPEMVQQGFLWIEDISATPNIVFSAFSASMIPEMIMPLLAGATTYLSSKTMQATNKGGGNPQQESMQKMMLYFFPLMLIYMSMQFPNGLILYWVVSNLFQTVQQLIINRPTPLSTGKGSEVK